MRSQLEEGLWFIHYPNKEAVDSPVTRDISSAREWVQAKSNGVEPMITSITFHDGSYIRRVYKGMYVTFDYTGKQCSLFIAKNNDDVIIHDTDILFNKDDEDCFCWSRVAYENGIELYYKEATP